MEDQRSHNKMGTMPVGKLLLTMSWPAALSMLIQACYNVVDTFFVAKLGEDALTAITLAFPVQMLMIALGVGTGVGINSLIARRLGAKMYDRADLAASNGIRLAFINWLVFLVVGVFFAKPFIGLFTADVNIAHMGGLYLTIVASVSIFQMCQLVAEKILQATGNMITPMCTNIIGAVVNIVLDPLLIFGIGPFPKLGIAGAAIATVIGQAVGMTVVMTMLLRFQTVLNVNLKERFDKSTLKEIYAVGAPTIVAQAIASVLNVGMNAILVSFSSTAVAIMGVYGRLQSFTFMPVFGINQGATPVMGFNYGARDKKRLLRAYKITIIMAAVVMACGMFVFQVFPRQLLEIFSAGPRMVEWGIPAFRAISLCFVPAAFGIVTSGLFGATGHGMASLFGSLLRQLIGILPLAYIFGRIGGLNMVWWAFPAAEVLGFTYLLLTFRSLYKKEYSKLNHSLNDHPDMPIPEMDRK